MKKLFNGDLAFDPDTPFVHFNEFLANRQSESAAPIFTPNSRVKLFKWLEELVYVGFGDTGTCVGHRDDQVIAIDDGMNDHPSLLGETSRITEDVEQDLLNRVRSQKM